MPCEACNGYRLKPEALARQDRRPAYRRSRRYVGQRRRARGSRAARDKLDAKQNEIAGRILKEIRARLKFLVDVGLEYLTLARASGTLSGGESQRIRLASQIGSGLTGVLYVLDEPSIGLHQRDNARLLETLKRLRDLGNTVIVVEHDEDAIRAADYVVDVGPGAGVHGGKIVAEGTPADIMADPNSLTGQYLTGARNIDVPERRPKNPRRVLEVVGARGNNLKNVTAEIPLGLFTCVTGVSGGGKSTLLDRHALQGAGAPAQRRERGPCPASTASRASSISTRSSTSTSRRSAARRAPIPRPIRAPSRRSANGSPACRRAKARGYEPGRFSFNVKGGRCEACQGDGVIKIEMHFLPDVYVTCDVCKGKRYNRETLEVLFKGKSIADVLDMTVEEALEFFKAVPRVRDLLDAAAPRRPRLHPCRPAGDDALRRRGAARQARQGTIEARHRPHALHPRRADHGPAFPRRGEASRSAARAGRQGNTVVVIEHNLEVIKTADWIIDLGPEGGDGGGEIVAAGTPEDIVREKRSYTGAFLEAGARARRASTKRKRRVEAAE